MPVLFVLKRCNHRDATTVCNFITIDAYIHEPHTHIHSKYPSSNNKDKMQETLAAIERGLNLNNQRDEPPTEEAFRRAKTPLAFKANITLVGFKFRKSSRVFYLVSINYLKMR